MYSNINLSKNDKAFIKGMKENYNCEININTKNGYYLVNGESFQILSLLQFIMIKILETDVELNNIEIKALCDALDIIKHYLLESEK